MGLVRKSAKPVTITNESGQPHLEFDIAGLKITTAPPKRVPPSAGHASTEASEATEPA